MFSFKYVLCIMKYAKNVTKIVMEAELTVKTFLSVAPTNKLSF